MEITITLSFAAAHHLPNVPKGHKCGNLHGHTFAVVIGVKGAIHPENGWITDFSELKKTARAVVDTLDHTYLNNIAGLENPTSETISIWLWKKLLPGIPHLARVEVHESPTSAAIYTG